jgi:hypothetical protein
MTRTEQLRTCKKCKNLDFDLKKGFICSVTSSYATFTSKCLDFKAATFVSKKRALKPSQLSVRKIVKSKNDFVAKNMLLIFAMVFIGFLMLDDPYLFSLDPNHLTESFARKLLNFFWGIPTGLLSLGTGVYFTFRMLIKM